MIGASLNQYQITASIGAGGMGEVFRARDTRLNRDVAIKVLPKDFVSDADRRRRFEQEAKTLAALNHPNILTIHDAGVHEGAPYLVSELLEGQTLREVLGRDAFHGVPQIPLRKATDYALQIAHGLAAAHGRGIIHRDLKPENIFVTKDGRVKILDFGLAKLKEVGRGVPTAPPDGSLGTASPTMRIDPDAITNTTEPGLVLGTPAYMSPEQVRGEPADHRADIFALGAMLYEMLSGTRAFRRDTPVASMNAVLSEEPPDLSATNANIPPQLERVVRRCLEKQPDNRFQSAKDLAFAIENAGAASSASSRSMAAHSTQRHFSFRGLWPWAVAVIGLAGLVFLLLQWTKSSRSITHQTAAASVRKFELTLPLPTRKTPSRTSLYPVISPDGRKLAYANADGLWLQWLDKIAPPLLLTAGDTITDPFWSPQSMDVGYFEGHKLYRVAIAGGNPLLVGTAPEAAVAPGAGGAWLGDQIVFATGMSGLFEVPAQGGKVTTRLAPTEGESDFHNASALPGGRGVLFVIHRKAGIDTIALWSPNGQRKVLLQRPGSVLWRPVFATTGHVLFHRSDDSRGVWAFAFSLEKLERTDEPFRVSDVGTYPSVANDGTLAFSLMTGDDFASRQLTWVERSGKILNTIGPPLPGLSSPRLSPDERRVVAASGESLFGLDLWLFDVTGSGAIPFTKNQEADVAPRWWNNGRTIVFARQRESGYQVLSKSADGATPEELLFEGGGYVSRSGKYLLVTESPATINAMQGYVLMADAQRKRVALPEAFQRIHALELSPDDRLLAYHAEEFGRPEVYLVDFPGFTNRAVVSRGGGYYPEWSPNGTELFYLSSDGRTLMSARLKPDGHGTEEPTKVFDLPESIHGGFPWWPSLYTVAQDGNRFLMVQKVPDKSASERAVKPNVRVALNWFEEFREKK